MMMMISDNSDCDIGSDGVNYGSHGSNFMCNRDTNEDCGSSVNEGKS